MHKSLFKKGLVVGIIFLFIGISVISSTGKINIAISKTRGNDGSLLGYVNDTSRNPIEGALVRVHFHETYEEDISDEDGYYHVTNIPICYCMKNANSSKDGYKSEWVLLSIAENTTHDFILTSGNNPPNIPDGDGPLRPKIGLDCNYIFYTTDPDGDNVSYYIDWGDGNVTDWIGPFASGDNCIVSHTWTEKGTYILRSKAKDHPFEDESDWLEVIIKVPPKSKPNAISITSDNKEDCIECQSNGSLCILYLFLRNRAYLVLFRLQIYGAFLYGFGFENLLYIFLNFVYIPQVDKLLYYEEKLVEYDCGVPPGPYGI